MNEVSAGAEFHNDVRVATEETMVDRVHQIWRRNTPGLVFHIEALAQLVSDLGVDFPEAEELKRILLALGSLHQVHDTEGALAQRSLDGVSVGDDVSVFDADFFDDRDWLSHDEMVLFFVAVEFNHTSAHEDDVAVFDFEFTTGLNECGVEGRFVFDKPLAVLKCDAGLFFGSDGVISGLDVAAVEGNRFALEWELGFGEVFAFAGAQCEGELGGDALHQGVDSATEVVGGFEEFLGGVYGGLTLDCRGYRLGLGLRLGIRSWCRLWCGSGSRLGSGSGSRSRSGLGCRLTDDRATVGALVGVGSQWISTLGAEVWLVEVGMLLGLGSRCAMLGLGSGSLREHIALIDSAVEVDGRCLRLGRLGYGSRLLAHRILRGVQQTGVALGFGLRSRYIHVAQGRITFTTVGGTGFVGPAAIFTTHSIVGFYLFFLSAKLQKI